VLQVGRYLVRFLISLDLLNCPNPSAHTMALRLTQPLTEMRNLPGGKRPQAIKGDLTAMYEESLESVGTSTSLNPVGFHGR
jgi:hypothetical protein